jgi:ribonuclease P protein component
VVIADERARAESRLGVTVSSRVGNSVVRNRLKRIVREIYRTRRETLSASTDLVVIAKRGAHVLTFHEVESEIVPAFREWRR